MTRPVREDPHRQPGRDRPARGPACRELGDRERGGVLEGGRRIAVGALRRRGGARSGRRPTARSYLHIPSIIGAALKTGADAIHPGYGFLSEDPYFAEICADNGITFIGPPPDVMEKVGNKAIARDLMSKAGLPLLPGHRSSPVTTADEAQDIADDIGYPVIIKAAAGGGGRGHDRREPQGGSRATRTRPPGRRRRRSSRTAPSTSSATSRHPRTPRSRSCATATERASTWVSATARCSGGTRS